MPECSVVIPTFNRKTELLRLLGALAGQTIPPAQFEVIVVDDGSTDGTDAALTKSSWPFAFRYIQQANAGPGAARNRGVAEAQGAIIAFTEDDVLVHPDWIARATPYFQDLAVGLVEGRTVYMGTREDVRRFEKTPVHSFIPCNLFVRRESFLRVGGYDTQFYDARTGLYFREDADLGFSLLAAGVSTVIDRNIIVEHPRQFSSLGSSFRHVRRYMFDPLLYRKHPGEFRERIEVKRVGRLTFRRPQHYCSVGCVLLLMATLASWMNPLLMAIFGAGAFVCSQIIRYKYQGAASWALHRLNETAGFLFLPLVYAGSFLKGCVRYKSFGALL
jgi:glycosyltransferase involved in cell wall biosynthesis